MGSASSSGEPLHTDVVDEAGVEFHALVELIDLVLERNAAQVILYMKEDITDLTQKVIDHYNALKSTE